MRYPRIDFPNARHHLMNRGSRRENIFPDDVARRLFLDLLAPLSERFGVDVHAYALMPNHYHLLVTSRRGRLDRAMRFVSAEFTRRTNERMGWDGPLFRGRYKNRLVETDDHWRYLLLYLHANPVKAGLATADWTSHQTYLGTQPAPPWLETASLTQGYGSVAAYAESWRQHVGGTLAPPAGLDPDRLWTHQHSAGTEAMPHQDDLLDVARALDQVAEVTGTPRETLVGPSGRGVRVPARWLAMWWLSRKRGVEHGRIRAAFGVGHDAVSRDIRRFEARRHTDARFAGWVDAMMAGPAEGDGLRPGHDMPGVEA
jgi:REP element-mobilizing transposase RayT